MRLVSRGVGDTQELRLSYGQWSDENGVPVEIEWVVSDGHAEQMFSQPLAGKALALALLAPQVAE